MLASSRFNRYRIVCMKLFRVRSKQSLNKFYLAVSSTFSRVFIVYDVHRVATNNQRFTNLLMLFMIFSINLKAYIRPVRMKFLLKKWTKQFFSAYGSWKKSRADLFRWALSVKFRPEHTNIFFLISSSRPSFGYKSLRVFAALRMQQASTNQYLFYTAKLQNPIGSLLYVVFYEQAGN